jgi:hypothetical protein
MKLGDRLDLRVVVDFLVANPPQSPFCKGGRHKISKEVDVTQIIDAQFLLDY